MIKVVHAEETAEDAGALLHPSEVSTKQWNIVCRKDMTNSVKAIVLYMLCRSEIRVGSSSIRIINLYRLRSEAGDDT